MPIDQRRVNGPEASQSYKVYSAAYLKALETELKRTDRKANEPRKMFIENGVLSNARGSAYMEMGNTKVTVAVFDPREIPKNNKFREHGQLYCDFKFATFSQWKRKSPQTDTEEKCLAMALKRALQPAVCLYTFPNFQVDVFVHVLENDGSALAAAITAAGLAIADAGIPMYDVVTASSVGIQDNRFLIDPTSVEEDICNLKGSTHGVITLARLSVLEQISEVYQTGYLPVETVRKALEGLVKNTELVAPLIKQLLVKKVDRDVKLLRKQEQEKEVTIVCEIKNKETE